MPAALAVAAVLIAVVGVGLFVPFGSPPKPWGFVALVLAGCLGGLWEFSRAVRTRGIELPLAPLWVGAVGILVSAYTAGTEALLVAFVLTAGGVLIWRVLDGGGPLALRDATVAILAAAYIPFLAGFLLLMLGQSQGPERVLVFLALVIANDTGGYIAGVLYGRHPLAPTVSPKKSWEGFAGSVVLAGLVGVAGALFLLDLPWYVGLVLAAVAVAAATLGDLSESLIKRDLGVKDMGSLLPGHGGILDRVDSILIAAPVVFTAMLLTLGG
nr:MULTISPECIES: phosphatidate cytidylyltransferase [unclassified Pseudactinotalea]